MTFDLVGADVGAILSKWFCTTRINGNRWNNRWIVDTCWHEYRFVGECVVGSH